LRQDSYATLLELNRIVTTRGRVDCRLPFPVTVKVGSGWSAAWTGSSPRHDLRDGSGTLGKAGETASAASGQRHTDLPSRKCGRSGSGRWKRLLMWAAGAAAVSCPGVGSETPLRRWSRLPADFELGAGLIEFLSRPSQVASPPGVALTPRRIDGQAFAAIGNRRCGAG
jgi:hypothetical protein